MKRLDKKSDLLKTTLPQVRRLRCLEEENRRLKEAAQGTYPRSVCFLSPFPLCVELFLFPPAQDEFRDQLAAELDQLRAECQALKDSESGMRAECESLKASKSAARAELEGMPPTGVVRFSCCLQMILIFFADYRRRTMAQFDTLQEENQTI